MTRMRTRPLTATTALPSRRRASRRYVPSGRSSRSPSPTASVRPAGPERAGRSSEVRGILPLSFATARAASSSARSSASGAGGAGSGAALPETEAVPSFRTSPPGPQRASPSMRTRPERRMLPPATTCPFPRPPPVAMSPTESTLALPVISTSPEARTACPPDAGVTRNGSSAASGAARRRPNAPARTRVAMRAEAGGHGAFPAAEVSQPGAAGTSSPPSGLEASRTKIVPALPDSMPPGTRVPDTSRSGRPRCGAESEMRPPAAKAPREGNRFDRRGELLRAPRGSPTGSPSVFVSTGPCHRLVRDEEDRASGPEAAPGRSVQVPILAVCLDDAGEDDSLRHERDGASTERPRDAPSRAGKNRCGGRPVGDAERPLDSRIPAMRSAVPFPVGRRAGVEPGGATGAGRRNIDPRAGVEDQVPASAKADRVGRGATGRGPKHRPGAEVKLADEELALDRHVALDVESGVGQPVPSFLELGRTADPQPVPNHEDAPRLRAFSRAVRRARDESELRTVGEGGNRAALSRRPGVFRHPEDEAGLRGIVPEEELDRLDPVLVRGIDPRHVSGERRHRGGREGRRHESDARFPPVAAQARRGRRGSCRRDHGDGDRGARAPARGVLRHRGNFMARRRGCAVAQRRRPGRARRRTLS